MAKRVFAALFSFLGFLAASSAQNVVLPNSTIATLAGAKVVGPAKPSTVLHLTIGINPKFPVELQAFCDAVSDPKSPAYRRFLDPDQIGLQFGAEPNAILAVSNFLKAHGMRITLSARNRMAICVEATVAQAESAFQVHISQVKFGTATYRTNIDPVRLPASLAKVVAGVSGLSDFDRPTSRITLLNPALIRGLLQTAPSYLAGNHGEGRTVAFTNRDGLSLSSAQLYITNFGLPTPGGGALSNVQIRTFGNAAYNGSASGEGDVDLQMELGTAPLANIIIYDTLDDYVGLTTLEANDNAADVISESYGNRSNTADMVTLHNQHLAMTAQGMTYCVASGDNGTTSTIDTDYYPNIDPEVLNIGGTVANVDPGTGARITEDGWVNSGGGWDTLARFIVAGIQTVQAPFNTLPAWQHGNGVPTSVNFRLMPDISVHAAGDQIGGSGYQFYFGSALTSTAGTSMGSPVFAGALATLEQRLAAAGNPSRLGRMQNVIYGQNGRSDVWFDILTQSNGTLPDGTTSNAGVGWDFVNGWGVPSMEALFSSIVIKPVSGTVTLQNYVGAVAGTSITVQFYSPGTSTLIDTKVTTLDSAGQFTVQTQAIAGNYDIDVKASHWLRRKATSQALSNSGLAGLSYSLINGDINGDNSITLSDFSLLRTNFGTTDPASDLNGDGHVTLSDFVILRTNFGQIGD